MNHCAYVRKQDGQYEFGHMKLEYSGEKKEKRERVALGVRATYEEALKANHMALKGMRRIGNVKHVADPWTSM
jgi:hypothetical protein